MSRKEIAIRYSIFLVGLFFVSLGIALTTKADLGTSPLAAIPYTLSLILPKLTLGNWTILFNFLFIIAQIIILRSRVVKVDIFLQVILTLVFGYCCDFCMWLLTGLDPAGYVQQFIVLLAGCVIMAFGVYLEVLGDVVMLPGDAFAQAVTKVANISFGNVRLISDGTCTAIAAVLCLIFLGGLIGVREGTVVAAMTVGNLVKVYMHFLGGVGQKIFGDSRPSEDKK